MEVCDADRTVSFPVRFDRSFDLDNTNLLSRMVELWEKFPSPSFSIWISVTAKYGTSGCRTSRFTRCCAPGSFVQMIRACARCSRFAGGRNLTVPIYFVELRDGYACSWCDLLDDQLLLLPHPLSPCSVRKFKYGTDAEIVGQVRGGNALTDLNDSTPDASAKLPRRV